MKRKILFVVHQLNHGGVQKSLLAALDAIDYEENEVTLYIRKNRVQLIDDVNKNVEQIIVNEDKTHYYRKPCAILLMLFERIAKTIGNKNAESAYQKKLVTYINESQMKYEQKKYFIKDIEYDVAVSYIQGYTAQFVAEYIKARKKVMFFHGSVDENHDLHEKIMPKYQKIVGVNHKVQEILEELYPTNAEKMTYLENYVDAALICQKSKEFVIPRKNREFMICSCGRLAPVKGYDLAIDAAKYLKKEGVSFYWYLVGDGPERTKLENLIKENDLSDYIEITGMKDNPYPYIVACDIYVQSSYEEAHPLTIIEAMILKKPIVTTATVGGMALINHKKTGLIVEINVNSLVESINQLAKNQDLLKKIQINLKKNSFEESFSKYRLKWKKLLQE